MREWLAYWRRTVERVSVARYHFEKPCHSLMLGAFFSLFLPQFAAVCLAVVAYLIVGKALCKSAPSKDWIADLLIGSLAIVAQRCFAGDGWVIVYAWLWVVLYGWLVMHRRWAAP